MLMSLPWLLDRFTELPLAAAVTARPLWTVSATAVFLTAPSLFIGVRCLLRLIAQRVEGAIHAAIIGNDVAFQPGSID